MCCGVCVWGRAFTVLDLQIALSLCPFPFSLSKYLYYFFDNLHYLWTLFLELSLWVLDLLDWSSSHPIFLFPIFYYLTFFYFLENIFNFIFGSFYESFYLVIVFNFQELFLISWKFLFILPCSYFIRAISFVLKLWIIEIFWTISSFFSIWHFLLKFFFPSLVNFSWWNIFLKILVIFGSSFILKSKRLKY